MSPKEMNACVKANPKQIVVNDEESATTSTGPDTEKWYAVAVQIFIPFLLAGLGTIGAGVVLGSVQEYKVFQEVKALYILVPALLGLKGNLDMCLASRLSTQANLGHMKGRKEILKMVVGNMGLVQIQSIVATSLVTVFAIVASQQFKWEYVLLLASSGLLTATLSCFVLDFLLIFVIWFSRKIKLNPDNLATPLAASIGDVVSLLMLSTWAKLLYEIHEEYLWVLIVIIVVYVCILLPIWVLIVKQNEYTNKVLTNGWVPVISALFISGFGGLVLDSAVDQFDGYSVFQPIINGIGGNLVSVHASRISTMLHKTTLMGIIPPHTKQWVAPWTALFRASKVLPASTARILLTMSIPGHIMFAFIADVIYKEGKSSLQISFLSAYILVGLVQLLCLLYLCHLLVHTLWRYKIDPDNFAIPFLTATGDLLGSVLLYVAFVILRSQHCDYTFTSA